MQLTAHASSLQAYASTAVTCKRWYLLFNDSSEMCWLTAVLVILCLLLSWCSSSPAQHCFSLPPPSSFYPLIMSAHARENLSSLVECGNIRAPFAEGSFRHVALGQYTDGPRNGESCAAKWSSSL